MYYLNFLNSKHHASHKHNKTFSFFPPGGSVVQPTCIGLHARFIIAKKKEEKEGVGKAMMGREVNSIATAREKCRQLLWQAALQLYVELRPSADGCPSVCPFPAPAAALHSSLVGK